MLHRRSIRMRIVVLVLVPVIALLALYAEVLNLTLGNLLTLKQEAAIRQLVALPVAHVQDQLGKERTLALAYLARPGHNDLSPLLKQEAKTDNAIAGFRMAVRIALRSSPVPKERQAFLSWQRHLSAMEELRTSVVSLGFSKIDAADAYSTMLNEGDNVLNQAILPVLTGPIGIQATDVLTMAKASQALGEESDLLRADMIAHSLPPEDLTLISRLAVLHQEEWSQTLPDLEPVLQNYFHTIVPQGAASQLMGMETDIASGRAGASKVPLGVWTAAETAYQQGYLKALLKSAATLARQATTQAKGLAMNLMLIASLGLLAIVVAIAVGLIVGRGLIRQLGDLRQSAVRLSTEQLPGAISRLRAGEDVDVGAEVPQLEPSNDEIGQVRQAFNAAARTAIAAAVDEVKIRRGVNDVFRSLARRNQSLLTRQLQLLDAMERRVHDPEELADLFRVDHMTTRMRRHAEGLLIVAGGSSGRTWREPVPIVDVMRAAAAEVEDYTRIRVTSRTAAALAGHAIADIIHLLAELIENATTFSPAHTPVRVDGDRVAHGLVVEIEDRGLGMSDSQLAEVNALLADPPLFDLSGSDQLGLFIAGQLSKRHDVKVTLRGSAYGGITAVVLIPRDLVVDGAEPEGSPAIGDIRELGGRPIPQLPGAPAQPTHALTASPQAITSSGYLIDLETKLMSSTPDGQTGLSDPPARAPGTDVWPTAATFDARAAPELPTRQPGRTGLAWGENGIPAYLGPVSWPMTPISAPPTSVPPNGSEPADADLSGTELVGAEPGGTEMAELDGLPVRVRQANLAPQLRQQSAPGPGEIDEPASGPTPEAARSTMAALQLGWERGRSATETADSEFRTSPSTPRPGDSPDEGGSL